MGAGYAGSGFVLSGSFLFELNTTNAFVGSIAGQEVDLPQGPYAKIEIAGQLKILSLLTVSGSFEIKVQSSAVMLHADAHLVIFGVQFTFIADVQISAAGLALSTQITLSTASAFIPFSGFEIMGSFTLKINTTNQTARASTRTRSSSTSRPG